MVVVSTGTGVLDVGVSTGGGTTTGGGEGTSGVGSGALLVQSGTSGPHSV